MLAVAINGGLASPSVTPLERCRVTKLKAQKLGTAYAAAENAEQAIASY